MEARIFKAIGLCVLMLWFATFGKPVFAAGYRTANFTVDAPTPRLAKEIGDAAENYRSTLAKEWLGNALPNWSQPCPIKARVAPHLGAGGATSFVFDRGEVFGWRMEIQGSRERILDSVVPHEVTHTIFASYFRQPIPRWADEGACTTVEHRSEIAKQDRMLVEFLGTRRGIPFSNMFAMKEYPRDVLPLYAQGYSLVQFLIAQRGKREFVSFIQDGLVDEDWIRAISERYGYRDLLTLQNSWNRWVAQGRPPLQLAADADTDKVLLAAYEAQPARRRPAAVIRGQDPATVQARGAKGIDGPMKESSRSDVAQREPWAAVATAQPPITPTPQAEQTWPAEKTGRVLAPGGSVYDARGSGRTLR